MQTLIIGGRVLKQLRRDKRFFALSIVAPLIIIYFLKLLFDAIKTDIPFFDVSRYAIPVSAFIVHFLSFILCAILLVQERTGGTLERMFISGFSRPAIISGYTLGYFGLATLQAIAVETETLILFDLDFSIQTVALLFAVIWLLAVVSVMLGIFVSTFAKHEGHVFPFIPLIILPSLFLSGMLIDGDKLPAWAEMVGKMFPLHYANNILQVIIRPEYNASDTINNFVALAIYAVVLLGFASVTLKETE